MKQIGSDDDGDGVDTNNNNNNNNDKRQQQQRQKRGLFKFLFYDDDEDDDDDDDADDMEEEEEEALRGVEDETRHFFLVTKETELHMYFTALSRVETECIQRTTVSRSESFARIIRVFQTNRLSRDRRKASVEKSMEKLRAMEFEIKSSMHETLLETTKRAQSNE